MAKKRKIIELKREIEQKRKEVMERINNDIKFQIKKLNDVNISEEQKREIEKKIEEDKVKLNNLVKEEQEARNKEKEEKKQQVIAF